MKGSLKRRLLWYFSLSMAISFAALGLVFWNTLRLQHIADSRFQDEMRLQQIQEYVRVIQPSLRDYLTSWSSEALSRLLFNMESLRELIPDSRPIEAEEAAGLERRLYFLLDAYFEDISRIIEHKRARRVESYTREYEDLVLIYAELIDSVDQLSLSGLRVQLEEYSGFMLLFGRIQLFSLIQILIATVIAYSLLLRSIAEVTEPLYELSAMAARLSANDYGIEDIHYPSVKELDQLADAFNSMKHSISEHVRTIEDRKLMEQQILTERLRNLKMEQLLKRMELYTMQAQMNPHFLFNTLNAGVQLAILEEADKTADFMDKLSALFRINTRASEFFVPLRHEIEGLRIYLDILRIRFPQTLELDLQLDHSLLDRYRCPAMIIQPLVENSIIHGFRQHRGTGRISIFVGFDDDHLIFSVRDNGSGIPEETRSALLVPHAHDYQHSSKLMGLENVIQRCYFFYPGREDIVQILSSPENGTEIIIRIPTEVEPCIES